MEYETCTQKRSVLTAPGAHRAYITRLYMYEHTTSADKAVEHLGDKFV